ncbi:translation initiation factor IF-5A [archaeon]|nr:translation initiation factor IF-5A [archaeon]
MSVRYVDLGSIKEGQYIVMDDEVCRVVSVDKSKPGKHGSAKARVVGIGVFDGSKHTLVAPVDTQVAVPVIEKRKAQVLAIMGDFVQLMDLETYETYEVPLPSDPELREKVQEQVEVEVWHALGKRGIMRVFGS